MKFCWCTISVEDMDASLAFYQDIVGLPLNKRFAAGPNVEIAFLGEGETKVELICDTGLKPPGRVDGIFLGFEVESADKMMEFVKEKGLEVDGDIFQPNPHIKFFFIKDPNGVSIQFVENIR